MQVQELTRVFEGLPDEELHTLEHALTFVPAYNPTDFERNVEGKEITDYTINRIKMAAVIVSQNRKRKSA